MVQEYLKKSYYNYLNIFTDGSKHSINEHVRGGIYLPEFDEGIAKRISNRVSVYTAELTEIISLSVVEDIKPNKVVICSDSAAAIESIKSGQTFQKDILDS